MNNTEITEIQNNYGKIVGKICEVPKISHQIEGENFLEFKVEVERLSKVMDIIPVTISQRLLPEQSLKLGDTISLIGEYRSYNKFLEEKSKLILHFFAKELQFEDKDATNVNEIKLTGFICKAPIYRTTPLSREICDVLIAVNRTNNMKSDYIPCIFWGRNARFIKSCPVGTKIEVSGRIQSRIYTKMIDENTSAQKTAYELSCQKIAILSIVSKLNDEKVSKAKEIG